MPRHDSRQDTAEPEGDNASSGSLASERRPPSDTVGTGSFVAIGCTVVSLLAIGLGVAVFFLLTR